MSRITTFTTPSTGSPSRGGSSSAAGRLAQNSVFERFARAGFVMTGLVHLLVGYIAIRIALGGEGGSADQSGAMAELAEKPGGGIILWLGAVAFAMLGLWRLVESALGSPSKPDPDDKKSLAFHRGKAFGEAVLYIAFAISVLAFARGSGKSSGEQNAGITARLMQSTAGTIALVIGALIIIGIGGYYMYKGATKRFMKDLEGGAGAMVRRLGTVGYLAKGAAVAAIGVLVIVATTRSEPDKASGLDGALKTLGAQPYGVVLLIAAGLGIITYGLYSFARAEYAKM
ncbi:DUF1206 domain-containing protein [Nocardia sp. NPDC005366]|uniref:DUF1206 domain-containing protein n=1 Tax=Nocardia sp. NPDC005366 TaxID=3156878 RepID=UPI0033A65CF0